MRRKKVTVLFGGKSSEHEISLVSGHEVIKNLDSRKYNVSAIKISRNGDYLSMLPRLKKSDVVFIAMHGPFGEDGTIQGMLELAGVKYTGSGVLASALGMNKALFREVLSANKIHIPRYVQFRKGNNISEIYKKLGSLPYFVKPSNQGSSVGMSIVREKNNLKGALDLAFGYSNLVLVDKYVKGKEITCSIMGNENPYALPIIEIVPKKGEFFDYKSKYEDNGSDEIVPARISDEITKKVQKMAISIYKIIGCRGFGRVDFILENDKVPICLEINTIPGLTPASLFPKSARAAGMTYSDFLDKLIEYAI